jgi:hypothetical protein
VGGEVRRRDGRRHGGEIRRDETRGRHGADEGMCNCIKSHRLTFTVDSVLYDQRHVP